MFFIKTVFIDRDGVINQDLGRGVESVDEFHIIPGVIDAISYLNSIGVKVIVITNQALVGRGVIDESQLNKIHDHMRQLLHESGANIDDIYICTSDDAEHPDRKPNPGMLLSAVSDHDLDKEEVVFIGDDTRDLVAAQRAGVKSGLVRTGKGIKTESDLLINGLEPAIIADNLKDAVFMLFPKENLEKKSQ